MKILLLALCSVAICRSDIEDEWAHFKATYKKVYDDPYEEQVRHKIFLENRAVIEEHNGKYKKGLVHYEMGMNQYGDMTQEEFERIMLGVNEETSYDDYSGQSSERSVSAEEERQDTTSEKSKKYKEVSETTGLPDDNWTINRLKRSVDSENVINSVKQSNFTKLVTFIWTLLKISKQKNETVETVNWLKAGAVSPVRDQKQCGSCWAFSATGALESHTYLKKGKMVQLSVQNLVDCSKPHPYGNLGCKGGLMDAAFHYVKDHGLSTEESYPYIAKETPCRYERSMMNGTCRGYVEIWSGEKGIMTVLREVGPVSVVIDASTIQFRFYKRGLYENEMCASTSSTNHAVLAVGYGRMNGKDYWLVKNSWGPGWGESGFFKISRSLSCGINDYGVYPVL